MPISSATNNARRGSARSNTKPPLGPLKSTGSPTLSVRSHCDPIPPGATSTESVSDPLCAGVDSMLQARTVFGPNGTEIHCPASNVHPAGSLTRRSTSMTSGVGQRRAVTTDLHSRGFCAIAPSLARECVLHAAVHRDRAARGLGRPVGGQEQHRLGDVFRKNRTGQDVALAVE